MSVYSSNEYDYLFKVVVTEGSDSKAGVSSLISRGVDDKFDLETRSTIGVNFRTKTIRIRDQVLNQDKFIKTQLWDGYNHGDRFTWHNKCEFRGAVAYVLVYDIAKSQTFKNIKPEIEYVRENCSENSVLFLVGNKSDLKHLREVSFHEGKEFADKEGLPFIETSALDSSNVNELFEQVVTKVYQSASSYQKQVVAQQETIKNNETFRKDFQADLENVLNELKRDLSSVVTFNVAYKLEAKNKLLELRDEISKSDNATKEVINDKVGKIYNDYPELYKIDCVQRFVRKYYDEAPQCICSVM